MTSVNIEINERIRLADEWEKHKKKKEQMGLVLHKNRISVWQKGSGI